MAKKPETVLDDDYFINTSVKGYNSNQNLKKIGEQINWTPEMIQEYQKCKENVLYFAEKYYSIIHVDEGLQLVDLYDYQKDVLKNFVENRWNILLQSRQSGKCELGCTKFNLRNKKTGKTLELTAKEFHELQKSNKN